MPCAATHQLVNFTVTGVALAAYEPRPGQPSLPHPAVAAPLSAAMATLPDFLEPATNGPHHRQFFHSLVFAGVVAWGVHETYQWRPTTPFEELVRTIVLVGGSAYLLHLVADAFTARGIPLVGHR